MIRDYYSLEKGEKFVVANSLEVFMVCFMNDEYFVVEVSTGDMYPFETFAVERGVRFFGNINGVEVVQ